MQLVWQIIQIERQTCENEHMQSFSYELRVHVLSNKTLFSFLSDLDESERFVKGHSRMELQTS